MAQEFKLEIQGAKELEEFLIKTLPAAVARRALLAGLKKSAEPMVNFARATAPRDSGALSQSIGMVTVPLRKTQRTPGMENAAAAIEIGPLMGTGGRPMSAWLMYKAHHADEITVKKGTKIGGYLGHAHLMEFGFTMRSGRKYPALRFLETAGFTMAPVLVSRFVREVRKKVDAAIKRHNARSPVKK